MRSLLTIVALLVLNFNLAHAHHQTIAIQSGDMVYQGSGFREFGTNKLALYSTRGKGTDQATINAVVPIGNGRFNITLHTVGENIGQSSYQVKIGDKVVGQFTAPKTNKRYDESAAFTTTFEQIEINEGEQFYLTAINHSHDGKNFSRGIWSKIEFTALDHDPGKNKVTVNSFRSAKQIESGPALVQPRKADGDSSIIMSGQLKQWHDVILTLDGPFAHEQDIKPNPFLDYRMTVTFAHESGEPTYSVPGYFAADGSAGQTSAEAGNKWRAHVSPDKPGIWHYQVSFVQGEDAAVSPAIGETLSPYHGRLGSFYVKPTDKTGKDFRAKGRLEYVGAHYLRHAGSGEYFFKAGPDAPETLLAYVDIDNTINAKKSLPLKIWQPHQQDAQPDDPTWKDGKGKNLLGALNYLASKNVNAFSFLTYNAAGDGDNIWPYVERNGKFHFDTSKLDQWGYIFSHAQALGLYLHFKLQENENDDHRFGAGKKPKQIVEALDAGLLGKERKLYFREMIARYSHHLGLNWNLGEENTQTPQEQKDMATYILNVDPYDHNIVIHSFPAQQKQLYTKLLGPQSVLTGTSLQNSWRGVHQQTLYWLQASRAAGKPWVVANDEQNPASMGVPPDPGYKGFDGWANDREGKFNLDDIRKKTLWGNLMAGGAGVEYYFGYRLAENDLLAEDFRSRDRSWDYAGIAVTFFQSSQLPFHRMSNQNQLVKVTHRAGQQSSHAKQTTPWVLTDLDQHYLVYFDRVTASTLDMSGSKGQFSVRWFNPRTGQYFDNGSVISVAASSEVNIGLPPLELQQDWLAIIRQSI